MADLQAGGVDGREAMAAVTDVARIALSCGSFDALRAVHFQHRFPPHFHDTFAIGVVESGTTRLRTLRGEWTANPGTILAFSPGEIHGADPVSDGGFTYRMIYPAPDFLREVGADLSRSDRGLPLFALPVIADRALAWDLQGAHVPLMEGTCSGTAEARLLRVLKTLVARYALTGMSGEPFRVRDIDVVERARDYLHDRFAERVQIGDVAEVCGINPFRLIRLFHRLVGVPPYAYLVQLRVNRAQALLCQGMSVSDVAYRCGFSDQSHLTRRFKRAMGMPPGQYVRGVRPAARVWGASAPRRARRRP
jgi:AraC-like DNA-binding protein